MAREGWFWGCPTGTTRPLRCHGCPDTAVFGRTSDDRLQIQSSRSVSRSAARAHSTKLLDRVLISVQNRLRSEKCPRDSKITSPRRMHWSKPARFRMLCVCTVARSGKGRNRLLFRSHLLVWQLITRVAQEVPGTSFVAIPGRSIRRHQPAGFCAR